MIVSTGSDAIQGWYIGMGNQTGGHTVLTATCSWPLQSLAASSASEEGSIQSDTAEEAYSELESIMRAEESARLLFHQDQLLEEVQQLINNFDDTLAHLHHEKSLMDVMAKTADLKWVDWRVC